MEDELLDTESSSGPSCSAAAAGSAVPSAPPEPDDISEEESDDTEEEEFSEENEEQQCKNRTRFFHQRQYLLTYPYHIPKKQLFTFLTKQNGQRQPAQCFIAHEPADPRNNYEHTHVVIDWGKQFQHDDGHYLDYPWSNDQKIQPQVRPLKPTPLAWKSSILYITKQDKDPQLQEEQQRLINGEGKLAPVVRKIQQAKSMTNALVLANKFQDINAIATIFRSKKANTNKFI